jgi:hypothetical protein
MYLPCMESSLSRQFCGDGYLPSTLEMSTKSMVNDKMAFHNIKTLIFYYGSESDK